MRQVDFTFRLCAGEDQVHQRVVRQIEQARQGIDFFITQACFVRVQKTRQYQVIFQQAAAAAPAQAGTVGRVGLMRCHSRVRRWVNTILRLP
jgi:hypothetical protein